MSDPKQKTARKKLKLYAFWYVLIAAPICAVLMFWPLADNVTIHGKIAHFIAIPLAFLSGLIFMGIIFFSADSGGDDQPNYVKMMEEQERRDRESGST